MKCHDRYIAIAMLMSVPGVSLAQSAGLQNFELRQLQLDRTSAILNAHASALHKRGAALVPAEVEGKIAETRRNSDGSITATTTRGKAVTYDPQVYRPLYVEKRDRTLFGLIPDRTMSVGAFWTRAPGISGLRTSTSYTDLPFGKLPNPDAKNSTSASLSQSASWMEGGAALETYGLNLGHQFNSVLDFVQYTGSLGITADQGATREMTGCLSVARSLASFVTLSVNGTYSNGGRGSNGWTAQADISVTVSPRLVFYLDAQPPSIVQGVTPWDIGMQATTLPNLSISFEFDQGQSWFLGLTHHFAIR